MSAISEKEEFDKFVERMAKIRELSSPPLYDFDDAADYSERLKRNFETIGKLAEKNRLMLEEVLYPLLKSKDALSEETVNAMTDFSEKLVSLAEDVTEFENLDLPIMYLVAEKLVQNAKESGTEKEKICRMDGAILAAYSMMNMTERIFADTSISDKYKKRGLEIGKEFLDYMKKENFLSIEDEEMRETVLTNARFSTCMYEHTADAGENEYELALLEDLYKIPDDEFYRSAVPKFDWNYYKIRTLGYILQSTDMGNFRGFTKDQIKRIVTAAEEMEALESTDPEYFRNINGHGSTPVFCARNRYLLGTITEQEYRKVLLDVYDKRDNKDVGVDGNFDNVLVPLEILSILRDRELTSEDKKLVKQLYQDISAYMFRMPNAGALSFVMEYFSEVVQTFIEVPGGITFEDFALQSLAALHPPTYIHSMMVGQISSCLCGHLIDIKPELLIRVLDCKNADEVSEKKEEILSFTYHAAVCHDFGKIPIIDTIFVYGRKLLDDEFDIIKTHPKTGYVMMKQYESTKAYADVALGHHRWYDDSKGYPDSFKTAESPLKTIIDIVLCADCMDAATDSVGRSYNKGKTLDDYIKEVREGSGTRYAPWLLELFDREDVCAELKKLLTEGREETYRDTYRLLKKVKEKAKNDKGADKW